MGIASGQVRRELRDEFEARFGIPMLEVYAMTEMGVLICSERLHDRKIGTCGRPHGWAEVMVADADDNPLPAGMTGQLLRRPKVPNTYMIEYINKPEATLAVWRNLWYHSGDLGYLDEDGYVHFVGREAHWIRRRGENVSAFEVEKAITAHESYQDAQCRTHVLWAFSWAPLPLGGRGRGRASRREGSLPGCARRFR